jgi:hypothetical protein
MVLLAKEQKTLVSGRIFKGFLSIYGAPQIPLYPRMLGVNPEPKFLNFLMIPGIDSKRSVLPAYGA